MDSAALNLGDVVEHERLVRNASCLGINDKVGGYDISPLTLEKWTALTVMQSPYVPPFAEPSEGDTLALLWLLSPDYVSGNGEEALSARRKFMQQRFEFVAPEPPFFWRTLRARGKHEVAKVKANICHQIIALELREYIFETLQDAPQSSGEPSEGVAAPEYYCDAVAIAAGLARAFGGGLQQYLHMPLKFIFQAMKENSEHLQIKAGQPVILHNPSDRIADAELEALNKALHSSGAKMHPDALKYFNSRN